MTYEKYILPGNKDWALLIGEPSLLIQKLENGVMIHELVNDVVTLEKIIKEVSLEQISHLELIGVAEGAEFSHCLFLANNYSTNFLRTVTAYRRVKPKNFFTKLGIEFYAEKSG